MLDLLENIRANNGKINVFTTVKNQYTPHEPVMFSYFSDCTIENCPTTGNLVIQHDSCNFVLVYGRLTNNHHLRYCDFTNTLYVDVITS